MRLELFFKTEGDLIGLLKNFQGRNEAYEAFRKRKKSGPMAAIRPIHGVNLPCKGELVKGVLRRYAQVIAASYTETHLPLCLHYSLAYEWYASRG